MGGAWILLTFAVASWLKGSCLPISQSELHEEQKNLLAEKEIAVKNIIQSRYSMMLQKVQLEAKEVDAAPNNASSDAAPNNASSDAAPNNASSDAAPNNASSDAAPNNASSDAAPNNASSDAAPNNASSDAAPNNASSDAATSSS
ncbi:circumsporozoite protein-like [Xiphophorus couchianus]|uniref:circumsporozoite protein-like n=1 Tax=Xiphophorus couchianus TaxID=32473 RepID=UPI001015DA94|nr:circumsporozoite protein-like [Xiphophorus couchianus]